MNLLSRSLVLCLFFLCILVSAQNTQRFSGVFSMPFNSFVTEIESKSDFKFYFNPIWTDSLKVNITAADEPIELLLEKVFTNTDLHFAVINSNKIYISHSRYILTDLPIDFFNESKNVAVPKIDFDYSNYKTNEKKQKLEESKVYTIGNKTESTGNSATLTGTVLDINSGEPIIGASVFIKNPTKGSATDQYGYFSLTIPTGRHEIHIQSIGMKSTSRNIILNSNGRLNIEMEEEITPLKEVVIKSDKEVMVRSVQMGMEKLDIKTMRQIPLALGETDIMKVVLTLPGVQSVGEGTVGLNVRGGATNQNLILLNDAVVFNPSHLFGFFSAFNPDVLKNVELYKSGIGAEYGGRLSSVLDVRTREGNTKKFSGTGGISPITGRFTLEGPIIKEKTSFILGGRASYSNWLLKQLDDPSLKNSDASFHDITGNITHKINDNNDLYLSGYLSNDQFRLNSDTTYRYKDRNASIKWKHIFNPKLSGVFTTTLSDYEYSIESDANPVNAFTMDFNINQLNTKVDFSFFPNAKHSFLAGASGTWYELAPGTLNPKGDQSIVVPEVVMKEQGLESAIYVSDNFEISPKLSIYAGLRYSFFQYTGPRDVYLYNPNASMEVTNIIDTVSYKQGDVVANYHGPEPRISMRYAINKNSAVKVSYNRMRQYIQMLSNTAVIAPTDIWKLSDTYIQPQVGDQISIGFYQYFKGNTIEFSTEAYYKTIDHAVDFKNGATLLLNHEPETVVQDADGKAYGIEFLLKKSSGKINGWISYTYSRTFLKTNANFPNEVVNNGEYYPANYDKPHAFNFIGNYKFNRRFNFSLNVVYSTGRPITLPIAKFDVEGTSRIYYSDRNQYRIPDYFRTDISINVEGNHKIKKLAHSSWTFAVYNLFGRDNPFSVYFVSEEGKIKGYKLSIFAKAIPTITYNFKF